MNRNWHPTMILLSFKDLNLNFFEASPKKVVKILKGLKLSKAADIDNRWHCADILARPVS